MKTILHFTPFLCVSQMCTSPVNLYVLLPRCIRAGSLLVQLWRSRSQARSADSDWRMCHGHGLTPGLPSCVFHGPQCFQSSWRSDFLCLCLVKCEVFSFLVCCRQFSRCRSFPCLVWSFCVCIQLLPLTVLVTLLCLHVVSVFPHVLWVHPHRPHLDRMQSSGSLIGSPEASILSHIDRFSVSYLMTKLCSTLP